MKTSLGQEHIAGVRLYQVILESLDSWEEKKSSFTWKSGNNAVKKENRGYLSI